MPPRQRKVASTAVAAGDPSEKQDLQLQHGDEKVREDPRVSRRSFKLITAFLSILCFAYTGLHMTGFSLWSSEMVSDTINAVKSDLRPDHYTKHATTNYEPALPFSLEARALSIDKVREADSEKRDAILEAFDESWSAYVKDAWGFDEYHPLTKEGSNFSRGGGVGYFIVDALDVLLLTGRKEEFERARDWVRASLNWEKSGKFSVFETTIRTLGGLLSAHALCLHSKVAHICSKGDADLFLEKALDLAEHLRPAFEATKLGIPLREVDFLTGEAYSDVDNRGAASLAEVSTIQLEFKYLAHVTGDESWWRLAEKPMQAVRSASKRIKTEGILPIFLNPQTGDFYMTEIRLGSRGDSYYEYLIKQYLQTNRTEAVYDEMYRQSAKGIKKLLVKPSLSRVPPLIYTAEIAPRPMKDQQRPVYQLIPKQDHLVCFLGGSFMLGSIFAGDPSSYGAGSGSKDFFIMEGENILSSDPHLYPPKSLVSLNRLSPSSLEDWKVGHELIRTCVTTYQETKTGLSPEIAMFKEKADGIEDKEGRDWYIKRPAAAQKGARHPRPLIDAQNILRPETVESLFIAFHLTGDQVYREWGWEIFDAFRRVARISQGSSKGRIGAYTGIKDVESDPKENNVERDNKMETFWVAETLKYLFLLFSDQDLIRLDQWVFNTEAHPLPIFQPQFETQVV